jgi:hypothetical protein
VTTGESSLRDTALAFGVVAVVLGGLSFVALLWVIGQTDSGLMCSDPYTEQDRPGACSVYDVPWWTFSIAVLCAVGAVVALLASVIRPKAPR